MELSTSIVSLIVAGWAVMIFVPSVVIAVVLAICFGVAAAYVVYLDIPAATPEDLVALLKIYAPIAGGAVFVAYPVAALMKWITRKNTQSARR